VTQPQGRKQTVTHEQHLHLSDNVITVTTVQSMINMQKNNLALTVVQRRHAQSILMYAAVKVQAPAVIRQTVKAPTVIRHAAVVKHVMAL
jgi:hypothetical protein